VRHRSEAVHWSTNHRRRRHARPHVAFAPFVGNPTTAMIDAPDSVPPGGPFTTQRRETEGDNRSGGSSPPWRADRQRGSTLIETILLEPAGEPLKITLKGDLTGMLGESTFARSCELRWTVDHDVSVEAGAVTEGVRPPQRTPSRRRPVAPPSRRAGQQARSRLRAEGNARPNTPVCSCCAEPWCWSAARAWTHRREQDVRVTDAEHRRAAYRHRHTGLLKMPQPEHNIALDQPHGTEREGLT
jgi:hypothetical protein